MKGGDERCVSNFYRMNTETEEKGQLHNPPPPPPPALCQWWVMFEQPVGGRMWGVRPHWMVWEARHQSGLHGMVFELFGLARRIFEVHVNHLVSLTCLTQFDLNSHQPPLQVWPIEYIHQDIKLDDLNKFATAMGWHVNRVNVNS